MLHCGSAAGARPYAAPRSDKRVSRSFCGATGMQINEGLKLPTFDRAGLGQIVVVLQGGGTLGAYQVGVYQALREVGADWVIGTSIGAINASIIAGNPVEIAGAKTMEKLLIGPYRPFVAREGGEIAD